MTSHHQYYSNASSLTASPDLRAQVPLELNAGQALGIEVLCTFQMVFTVFAVCDQKRRDCIEPGNLAIGFAHSSGVFLGVSLVLLLLFLGSFFQKLQKTVMKINKKKKHTLEYKAVL